jgi:hypothetical protein
MLHDLLSKPEDNLPSWKIGISLQRLLARLGPRERSRTYAETSALGRCGPCSKFNLLTTPHQRIRCRNPHLRHEDSVELRVACPVHAAL